MTLGFITAPLRAEIPFTPVILRERIENNRSVKLVPYFTSTNMASIARTERWYSFFTNDSSLLSVHCLNSQVDRSLFLISNLA